MKVTLVNQEQSNRLYEDWSRFAAVCYNTTLTEKNKEVIGKSCHKTGHYSGSRTTYFTFHIEGVSRALTAQLNRHSIGCVINERSMRYVDFANAEVTMPPSIASNEKAKAIFEHAVNHSRIAYRELQECLKEDGLTGEANNQDARYVCPIGVQTQGMWAFTLEALEHIMNKRLCERSQWEIRELAKLMRAAAIESLPQLKDKLVPQCVAYGYCIENRMQCDKFKNIYPTKDEFIEISGLPEYKKLIKQVKGIE